MKFLMKNKDNLYPIFRIIVGLLFFMHGLQKFGLLGGQAQALFSLFGIAGLIEVVVGVALALGLFARWAAALGALEMLVAYVMVHAPQGWNPLDNKGELALLYFAAFLVVAGHGAGKWSIRE